MQQAWSERPRRSRVAFGVTLVLAMALAPLVQYAVAALAPFLVADLGLSRTQIGSFTSAMFVASAIAAPGVGRLVDRFGPRRMLVVLFVSAATAVSLLATTPGYAWLLVAALVTGVPMAIANPATNQLLRVNLPAGGRGLLMGIKQSGVKVGQTVASLALPAIAVAYGWRTAVVTLLALAASGLIMALLQVPAATARPNHSTSGPSDPATTRLVWMLSLYAVLMGAGQASVGSYLPLYAFEDVGLTASQAGAVAALVGATGVVSRITWARRAERTASVGLPLFLVAVGSAGSALALLSAAGTGPWLLILGAVLFGSSAPVWNVVAMLAIIRLVGEHATGRATGVLFLGFSVGFILGPVTFGALVDTSQRYATGWWAVVAQFAVGAAISLVVGRAERHVRG